MVTTGRYRPVQGAVLFLFFCTSTYSVLFGALDGSSAAALFNPMALRLWHLLLIVGTTCAMAGEVIQLRAGVVASGVDAIDKYIKGLLLEFTGEMLFVVSMCAFIAGTLITPGSIVTRMLIYIMISLGFIGRMAQIVQDIRRIRRGIQQVSEAATGEFRRP